MNLNSKLPVFNISNFDDYNKCMQFSGSFYVRNFSEHVNENMFIEKPHSHDFYLILLITKGKGIHTIDFLEYDVYPGAMFIVSPGQIHYWNLSNDVDGHILFFTKEYFLLDFNTEKLTSFPFFNSTFSHPFIELKNDYLDSIILKYELIYKEYKMRSANYQEIIRVYLYAMFIELSRVYINNNNSNHVFSYDLLQLNRYEALVDKYFRKHRPISCYSKKMNITDRQLSYLCKKTIDKTPLQILTHRIILEAKRLLIHSNLSVSSIASELNYDNSSYFIRLFKKNTNVTPEQFRINQYN